MDTELGLQSRWHKRRPSLEGRLFVIDAIGPAKAPVMCRYLQEISEALVEQVLRVREPSIQPTRSWAINGLDKEAHVCAGGEIKKCGGPTDCRPLDDVSGGDLHHAHRR